MTLTDAAADRVKAIMAKSPKPIAGLRVGVKNGGCAGMSYTMEYADETHPAMRSSRTRASRSWSIRRPCCSCSAREMDFQTTKLASQFVFNNPNQTSACGCGESVAISPADPASLEGVA